MRCDRIIILAAGRASRMKSSAENAGLELPSIWQADALTRPKPMIRIGPEGQPFLHYLLEAAEAAGFTEATLVVAPNDDVTASFSESWNQQATGMRMRIRLVVQPTPQGTGHAVQIAIENDPIPQGLGFVLCNGDNLPSVQAMSTLRSVPQGQALLAYHQDHLGLPPERAQAFALLQSSDGWLQKIIEKPNDSVWKHWLETQAHRGVSMNLFRLDPVSLLPALQALVPHPERGELELPTAIQSMLEHNMRMEVIPLQEPILDLTGAADLEKTSQGLIGGKDTWTLEVCASSPEDVHVAAMHGAQRVELCAHWECGGLTPLESDIRSAVQEGLPVHALIRPRAGHFTYSETEWQRMHRQIDASLAAGASRVVVGGLDAAGRFEVERVRQWVDAFGGHRLVIHRALDASTQWEEDAQALRALGVFRILSSGGEANAWEGRERIQQLLAWGFDVTVASGVSPSQKQAWLELGVRNFHASCRMEDVREVRHFDGATFPVSAERVSAWF
jgi:copper homeostasis protein CutC/dTDP-glucose pyrophosphorylase